MQEVLGHEPGTEIHSFSEIVKYLEALVEAASDRVRLFTYGTTWEGRELTYIAIGSPQVIADLDQHSEVMARLSDPRITSRPMKPSWMDKK